MTFASIFSGFGGADLGAHAAGLSPLWGVEADDRIAGVARANGLAVTTGDVLSTDWGALARPDWLHASPPCPSFSAAKTGGEETAEDVALAQATTDALDALRPDGFTLENVRGYEGSASLRLILAALERAGYAHTRAVLCAADYGVPQTRDRLLLVASRTRRPRLPVATHAERPLPSLFADGAARWNGWYAAVEDLLDALPDSALAPWQVKRLPAELRTLLLCPGNTSDAKAAPGVGDAYADEPARCVPASLQTYRAVLMAQGGYDGRITHAVADEPAFSVTANTNQSRIRALLVSSNSVDGGQPATRYGDRPSVAVDTKAERVRAVLVEGQNASHATVHRDPDRPSATVTALAHRGQLPRAILARGGVRVVQLSPRCLGRFQTFPDDYRIPTDGLPGAAGLACRGIGNACPPLMMQCIYEANAA